MIILSADPPSALAVLSGFDSSLTVSVDKGVRELLQKQPRYRVAVHTLGFPDDNYQKNLCHEILAEFGFDCHTFPALAIQGLITVQWSAGDVLHCYNPFFLPEPIYDILPPCDPVLAPSAEQNGWLWLAQQQDHLWR
jgi:hypothetical protein